MIDKNLLKEGDIFLFHTRGLSPISMAIRQLTQSFWNHTGVYCLDINKNGFIVEALGGVIKTPVEKYLDEKSHIIKVVRIRESAFRDISEYNEGIFTFINRVWLKIGSKYDTWAIVWLGFKYIFKGSYKKAREFIPIGNPLQKRDEFFCSELVCEGCWNISSLNPYLFQGNTKQLCDTTTPRDIGKSKNVEYICGKDML